MQHDNLNNDRLAHQAPPEIDDVCLNSGTAIKCLGSLNSQDEHVQTSARLLEFTRRLIGSNIDLTQLKAEIRRGDNHNLDCQT